MHLAKELLEEQNVDVSNFFYTRTVNSRKFNVSSDNFSLISRLKLDSLQYSECPWMSLIFSFERTGSIDFVKLANENGTTVFEDTFE